jgi:uncharacterized protein YbjT (DUF2867 family)
MREFHRRSGALAWMLLEAINHGAFALDAAILDGGAGSALPHPTNLTPGGATARASRFSPLPKREPAGRSMKIAVVSPTGNIGGRVVEKLLEGGANLVLLARNARRIPEAVRRRVEVHEGSLWDKSFVARATRGARALFWITPPNPNAERLRAWQNQLGRVAAGAVLLNDISHVVNVSAWGAGAPDASGAIAGLRDVELRIGEVAASVVHLRPGFLMETYLQQLEPLRTAGSVFFPFPGAVRRPFVAARDVGDLAARLLLGREWSGSRALGAHGPADLSFDEAAATLGSALGREVRHVWISPDRMRDYLRAEGASDDVASGCVDAYCRFGDDTASGEARTAQSTTPTSLAIWAREVLSPLAAPGERSGETARAVAS